MDQQLLSLLDELYRSGSEHDALLTDRLDRLRNVEPDTARFLAVLVRGLRPKRMLELGTSNGYSTIWLADAARATGAELVSVELELARTEQARVNLERAGVDGSVELRTENAAATLAGTEDASVGFVFLDAERTEYVAYLPDLVRVLEPAGVLVVDNVVSHADEVAEFRSLVEADERLLAALVPTGAGALVVVRER